MSPPVRVLYATGYDPSIEDLGGAAWVDRRFIAALQDHGAHVDVFAVTHPGEGDGAPWADVPLELAGHPVWAAATLARMLLWREPYQAAKYRWAPAWRGRRSELRAAAETADLVVTSQWSPLLLSRDEGVRVDAHVAHNVDAVLAVAHDPGLFRRMRNEHKTARVERALLRDVRSVYAISASDAHRLVRQGIAASAVTLAPAFVRKTGPIRGQIGFLGKTSWPPNRHALRTLTEVVMPAVRRQLPTHPPSLLVAGRGSESFDSPANGIVGLGKLEELATFYASIDAVVIPRSGETTGVSVKLLEALAHGVPAIVPSLLAHDAGVADGVIVADEPSEVATAALELLRGDGSAGTPQARSPRMSVDGFAQELLSLKRPSEEEGHEH